MTPNDKATLIEQMEKQRFLPVTEETFLLYKKYSALMDPRNPDEISQLLFYEGETYFKTGHFNKALSNLSRCLQAPKGLDLKYLDALVYNIMGLIYSYLGQESISINDLLQCKSICEDFGFHRELTVCCGNLGQIYGQLEDYDTAITYYDLAMESIPDCKESFDHQELFCHACRGIIYCKTGQKDKALETYKTIGTLKAKNPTALSDAAVLNFNIRLSGYLKDRTFFQNNFEKMISLISSDTNFLELSHFYFDTSSYLLEQHMEMESRTLLNHMAKYTQHCPLVLSQYELKKLEIIYARQFSTDSACLRACSDFIDLRPKYLEEQRYAKLYSLEYVERLRMTKNASEMYLQKSRMDQMTGLLNKYTIQFLIEEDLSLPHAGKQSAMILIDLDHFKQINDTLGHLAGDNFICQTASVIQNYFKDNALCGRIGGDEFLIYISAVNDISFIVLQTEILRQEIFRQTSERNITITTQASIGVAFTSEYCYDYESLFQAADTALYRAKTEGRNKVVVAE